MGRISASVRTSAPPDALWPLVRNLEQRLGFLPPDAFRDVEGDADRARFRVRVARGWSEAQTAVVRVVEGREVEERAAGDGIRYTAVFRLVAGGLEASVEYELAGVPRLVDRTVIAPMLQRRYAEALQRLVGEAEQRAAGGS